ncbi:TonB-dependent receptor [Pseudomaricurvus sp.]|uniref:TonB-dependent receptor n=1 Tax=Pseudomaricurvus sp. TaxID=2004510 RepID=UPI003F6BCB3D
MNLSCRWLPLALAVSASAGNIHAQNLTLEEVVVTAQKRAESLQDVPISVSAMSGEKLNEAGIPNMGDFSAYIPNFNVTSNAVGDVVSIRGIQSGILASIEQSVGTFVDGIYRGRGTQSRFSFLDVGTVEVLRGPQSTLFGKNTIGGALNITSAKPTNEFEAELSAMYEAENEETELKGYVSGPLTDTLRGRFAFQTRDMDDGWIENTYFDQGEPQMDEAAGRVSLEWDASDDLLVYIKAEHGDWDNKGMPYDQQVGDLAPIYGAVVALAGADATLLNADTQAGNGRTTIGNNTSGIDYGAAQTFEGDTSEVALRTDYSMDSGTLTAIAGYSAYEFNRNLDADFNALDGIGFEEYEDFEQKSLELRFVSELGNGFEYITGLYYQDSDLTANAKTNFNVNGADPDSFAGPAALVVINEHNQVVNAGGAGIHPGFPSTLMTPADFAASQAFVGTIGQFTRAAQLQQETESWAAFAQGTWDLTDVLHLTLGVRYGEEDKSASQSVNCAQWDSFNLIDDATCVATNPLGLVLGEFTPHNFDDLQRDEEDWTYTVNLQWDITSDIMGYATVSTGTKSGGFNNFALTANSDEAEFDQEKVKSWELGAKMTLLDGAAEVNMAIFDMDYSDLQASIFTGSTGFKVENAATATVRGFEMDGRWQATDSIMLRGSMGYVDFEFDEYPVAGCTDTQKQNLNDGVFGWGTFIKPSPGTSSGNAVAVDLDGDGATDSCEQNLAGGTNAFTPELTASLSLEHEMNLGDSLYLRTVLDANYLDDHHTAQDNDPLVYQDAYTLWNLTVTLGAQDGRWDVAFIGRNLTDEDYITYSNDMPLFAGNQQVAWGREASYGLRGRLRF